MAANGALSALLLVGSVGSGKTTVLLELGRRLSERGEPHALVDLDWLAWVEPSPSSELSVHEILATNLAAAVATFRRAGIHRVLLARHVTRAQDLAAIGAALGEADLTVIGLEVADATLEARLRARDAGRELEEHLAELGAAADFPYVPVPNDGQTVSAVADAILEVAGWQ